MVLALPAPLHPTLSLLSRARKEKAMVVKPLHLVIALVVAATAVAIAYNSGRGAHAASRQISPAEYLKKASTVVSQPDSQDAATSLPAPPTNHDSEKMAAIEALRDCNLAILKGGRTSHATEQLLQKLRAGPYSTVRAYFGTGEFGSGRLRYDLERTNVWESRGELLAAVPWTFSPEGFSVSGQTRRMAYLVKQGGVWKVQTADEDIL